MFSSFQLRRFLALAVFAFGVSMGAAQTAADSAAKEKAKSEVSKSKEQANAQRDRMIAEYEALTKQLKDATEEQKKAILAKMQDRKRAFEEAQNALHKQIRDEQRRQRQNAAPKR